MEALMNKVVVENSKNPHVLNSENNIKVNKITDNIFDINLNGNTIVTHGQHGTLKIESQRVIKYSQTEVNPITKKIQKAFD